MCVMAVAFLAWAHQMLKKKSAEARNKANRAVQAKYLYVVIIVLFTVFPIVSTTIFQTFQYDTRLGEDNAYLVADYSIKRGDPEHEPFVVFATCMAVVYCLGIPIFSLAALSRNLAVVQRFQMVQAAMIELEKEKAAVQIAMKSNCFRRTQITLGLAQGNAFRTVDSKIDEMLDEIDHLNEEEPLLRGLSPLYQDYKAQYWYFELVQFSSTLFLVAIVTTLPTESTSQVFIALMASTGMLLVFANLSPYLYQFENALAQGAQFVISFALTIGLLLLAGSNDSDDAFGSVLLAAVILLLFAAGALFIFEFDLLFELMFPKTTERFKDSKYRLFVRWGIVSEDRTSFNSSKKGGSLAIEMSTMAPIQWGHNPRMEDNFGKWRTNDKEELVESPQRVQRQISPGLPWMCNPVHGGGEVKLEVQRTVL